MRILLINPPCDPRTIGLRHMSKIEPLGLETVAAGVREHDVRLVDMEVAPGDLSDVLDVFAPEIVGVTSEIVHVRTALDALRTVRARYPRCLTVVGGHHPTMHPDDFADPAVDLIVLGEGVSTFREICAAREAGRDEYDHIAGLASREADGSVRRTAPRSLPDDLDDYPMPDRSLTAKYRSRYFYLHEPSVAAVRTSFGCTHFCTFCSVRVYSQGRHIHRAPEKVFEEIRSLDEDFVMFCDDHSFLEPARMRALGEMLLEAGIEKRYFAYARADSITAHPDLFELWSRVGLTIVMTGLEATDGQALKRAGKQTSEDTNEEAVRICQELGIGISAGFLVEPDFTRDDFERIDRYARERPSIAIVEYTALTPLPGTPLYRKEGKRLLTHDAALFDLQHFVLPTRLPARELYGLLLEYHGRSSMRFVRRLLRHQPSVFFSTHGLRILPGLLENARMYREAHLHAPDTRVDEIEDVQNVPERRWPAELRYDGWSGWMARGPSVAPILLDPSPDDVSWPDERTVVLLTHGHPEHVASTIRRLSEPGRAPLTIVTSRALCLYIERRSAPTSRDRLCAIDEGETREIGGWTIEAFAWTHMPLVPPEPRLFARHVGRLLRHPMKLAGIIRDGIAAPPHRPTLGYRLTAPGMERPLVYYGEGLHRRTPVGELRDRLQGDVEPLLVAGIEPEDVDLIPGLLIAAGQSDSIFFEPHAPWRRSFGMPLVGPEQLERACEQVGLDGHLAAPGEVLTALADGPVTFAHSRAR